MGQHFKKLDQRFFVIPLHGVKKFAKGVFGQVMSRPLLHDLVGQCFRFLPVGTVRIGTCPYQAPVYLDKVSPGLEKLRVQGDRFFQQGQLLPEAFGCEPRAV